MLTTCPNCLHVFQQAPCCTVSVSSSRMAGSVILQQQESDKLPVPSPSTPLSFVLPSRTASTTPWLQPVAQPVVQQPDTDLVRLANTMTALHNSGWYYEGLSWQESAEALRSTSPGTFLVRDSSDPRFLFSLSVQTERGPTSVRLHYVGGQFRLDAEPRLAPLMPLFDCVVQLVEYYIAATRDSGKDKEQVWVDARGQMYSHILLTRPLYKRTGLPSLQHLARLAINRNLRGHLPLPPVLAQYLSAYPYTH